jgi:hypothetical protein
LRPRPLSSARVAGPGKQSRNRRCVMEFFLWVLLFIIVIIVLVKII